MSAVAIDSTSRREIEVMSLVGFAHGVSHFFQLMIPSLFPWLMQEFGLNFTQVGMLTTVFFVISGMGQAAAGFVVDHIGARRALMGGIVLFVAAAVTLGLAPNYPTLFVAAILAGLGNCVFHPADFTLLNRNISAPRLGHAFSVHGLSGNLGYALAPVFLASVALATTWRTAAFVAAALATSALVLVFLRRETIKESPLSTSAATGIESSTFAYLGSGAVWTCFVFFLLITMAASVLQNYAPSVMHNLYGMSLAAGASVLTTYLLGGAAGMIAGGFLVARSDAHDRHIAQVLVAAAIFGLVLAFGQTPTWTVVPLMAAMGFCSGVAGPSRDMLVRRAATARFGERSFGRVYGFVYSGLDVGFALAPPLFGVLMDAGRFAWVLGGVALLQGLAVLAALRVGQGAPVAAKS